ncbi:Hypothetical predicted protein [Olea europaea subsp. europaea]|uniref:Uncharacterized protein n=1 Tax=Olea europaea subsp. europaea TaxID=158383 RepID=A0A8S0QAM9_OLEEU|nr:Hypothetical predicted protein [Olea europaea subsp. europaea]
MEKTADYTFFTTDLLRGRLLLADVIEPNSTIMCLSSSFRKRIQPEMAKIGARRLMFIGLMESDQTIIYLTAFSAVKALPRMANFFFSPCGQSWLARIRANVASLSCLFLPARCTYLWEMALMYAATVANSFMSLTASLDLILEPPIWWRTIEVAGNGSWIIGALCKDTSSSRHSPVYLGVISSSVELMAAPP